MTSNQIAREISPVSVSREMQSSYLAYSLAVFDRALPSAVDGLKTSQRRIIMGLRELNLRSTGQYKKVSRLEGTVLGLWHPQGGCAGTIINMGQQAHMRYTLTDIHGNAGGSIQSGDAIGQLISEDAPAAARYLEVKSTVLCEKLYIDQIDERLGYWQPNYDGSKSEPVRFVPALPALLLTGAQGIASGYATHHIPHNLDDVVKATVALIKNPKLTDAQLLAKFSHPPEPAQGGRVKNDQGIKDVILNGRGRVEVWGEWETTRVKWGKRSTKPAIIIKKLASGSSERFLDQVKDLADSERLVGLADAADHSNLEGVNIVLTLKSAEHTESVLQILTKFTGLKHTYNVNCTAMLKSHGVPVVLGARQAISVWYRERVNYLVDRNIALRDKYKLSQSKLQAVIKALDSINKFLKVVQGAKTKPEAIELVSKLLRIDTDQSTYLLTIPISSLISTEGEAVRAEYDRITTLITNLNPLCSSGAALDAQICSEVQGFKGQGLKSRSEWVVESKTIKTPHANPPARRAKPRTKVAGTSRSRAQTVRK